MIMAGLEFMGEVPFNRIYIHGTVRAQSGLKMSKSLGNAIDPLEVIDEIGADALRFSMIMLSAQDVYLSREKFEVGRNFTNKIWNAARFAFMNLEGLSEGNIDFHSDLNKLSIPNRWILSRLEGIAGEIEKLISSFSLSQAATELYHFVWNDFCDWYIELIKPTLILSEANPEERKKTQEVLFFVLERILQLLHPFMPFVTEEIWQKMKQFTGRPVNWTESLMLAAWPLEKVKFHDMEAEYALDRVQKAVAAIRDLRMRLNIPPEQLLKAWIVVPSRKLLSLIMHQFEREIMKLGRLESLEIPPRFEKSKSFVGNAFPDFEVFVSIEGIVDPAKECERIEKKLAETSNWMKAIKVKLSNQEFVKNAPAELVQKEKEKLADAEKLLKSNEELLSFFK